jgi:hypothetical protein
LSKDKTIHELKETAKWSRDPQQMKIAINELSVLGDMALPALEEIRNVTAYEDIKAACIEAIKAIKEKEGEEAVKKTKSEAQVKEEKAAGKTDTVATTS